MQEKSPSQRGRGGVRQKKVGRGVAQTQERLPGGQKQGREPGSLEGLWCLLGWGRTFGGCGQMTNKNTWVRW